MPTSTPFSYGAPPAQPDISTLPVVANYLDFFEKNRARALGGLADTAQAAGEALSNPQLSTYAPTGPTIGQGPGGEFYVQGRTIKPGDYAGIMEAQGSLDQPRQGRLPVGITPVSPEAFRALGAQIANPSTSTIAKQGFGRSVDVMQQQYGRAAQAFNEAFLPPGATGMGADMAERNTEELRMTSPYDRPWGTSSFGDYAVSTLAGLVPSVVGSIGAGIAGGAAGTAIGGPGFGTAAGAIAGATAYNYPLAVGDIAQRQIEETGKIRPGAAFGYGVPYALAESLPEVGVLGRVTGRIGAAGLKPIFGRGGVSAAGEVLRRAGVGGLIGATTEGGTEAAQQVLERAGAGLDLTSPQAIQEYVDSARAGALGGAVFGGAAHLFPGEHKAPAQTGEPLPTNAPADLLNQPSQKQLTGPGQQLALPYYPSLPAPEGQQGGTPLLPGPPDLPGLPPPNGGTPWAVSPTGEVTTGSPTGLPGPVPPRPIQERNAPGAFDLFGQPGLYTDPGQPPPPSGGGGGGGLSTADFYNQTPMGQHIADQLIAEHAPVAPAQAPAAHPSAQGGTFAEQLAALTGAQTPVAQRADVANEAIAAAGQSAFETLTGDVPSQEVGPRGTGTAINFQVTPAAPAGAKLRRGRTVAPAAPAVQSHAALKSDFATVSEAMDPITRKRIAKQLNAPKLGEAKRAEIAAEIAKHKQELPAAAQPVGHDPIHVGDMMGFGTTEPATPQAKLKRGKTQPQAAPQAQHSTQVRGEVAHAVEQIAAGGRLTEQAKQRLEAHLADETLSDEELVGYLYAEAERAGVTPTEVDDMLADAPKGKAAPAPKGAAKLQAKAKSTTKSAAVQVIRKVQLSQRGALRVVLNALAKSGLVKGLQKASISTKINDLTVPPSHIYAMMESLSGETPDAFANLMREAEAKTNVTVEIHPPGEAPVQRGAREPKFAIDVRAGPTMEITVSQPVVTDEATTTDLQDQVDNDLPEDVDEYTVTAINEYITAGEYKHAQMLIDMVKQGKSITRLTMTDEDRAAQSAKINERRPQRHADTNIEGGVDQERAALVSAFNLLGKGRAKHKAKISATVHEQLMALARNPENDVARLRSAALDRGVSASAIQAALDEVYNAQAETDETGGYNEDAKSAAMAEALDALASKYQGTTGKAARQAEDITDTAEAQAATKYTMPVYDDEETDVSTPTDEHVLAQLEPEDHATIKKVYGPNAETKFLKAFRDTINGTAKRVHKEIKAIIARISTAVMAVSMVFNPNVLTNHTSISLTQPAHAATMPAPAGVQMSEAATLSYSRVMPTAQGHGLIIVDKPSGEIHFFGKNGEHIASAPVLTGMSDGDVLPANVTKGGAFTDAQIGDIPVQDRVTPAGVFTTKAVTTDHGNALLLNNAQGKNYQIGIHNTYMTERLPRLATNDIGDNQVSYGCVNISPEMFQQTLAKDIGQFDNNTVVVIPHDLSKLDAMVPAQVANDPYSQYPTVSNPDRSHWDQRQDGSDKGMGWLGLRQRPDGKVSSEISAGLTIDGQKVEVPLMVPGLTPDEMDYLMTHDTDLRTNPRFFRDMPHSILEKAAAHARERMSQGKSPFRQQEETTPYDDTRKRQGRTRTPGAKPMPKTFMREDEAAFVGNGMSQADTHAIVQETTEGWASVPEIGVYEKMSDVPQRIRDRITPTAKAFIDHETGRIGIIAAHHADAADVRASIYHETLGHHGLRGRFTTRLRRMLADMYNTNAEVKRWSDNFLEARGLPKNPANIALAAEETLAHSFEHGVIGTKAWQRIVAYVRNMGRTVGMVKTYTDNDILSVLHKAQNYTMRDGDGVSFMDHSDAETPAVMMREWNVDQTMKKAPAYLKENAGILRKVGSSKLFSKGVKLMTGNQLADDYLPFLGATKAARISRLQRSRESMTNVLLHGVRKLMADIEQEPVDFRRRNKGIGEPKLDNISGYLEVGRRRGRWGYVPEDGRFAEDDYATRDERFHRGRFNAKGEQLEGEAGLPLLDPELEAAFKKFTPSQQEAIRKTHFELWNIRSMERETLGNALTAEYEKTKAKTADRIAELEHNLAAAHDTEGFDKAKLNKLEKDHAAAVAAQDAAEAGYTSQMRDLARVYRDMEYVPYVPMQRHGKFVVVGESAALQAARRQKTRPEGAPSVYAMEADPDHRFVHAVDSEIEAHQLVAKLRAAPEFSGGRNVYYEASKPGEELFKGSDVIAGLQKIIGNISSSGETAGVNNILLEVAQRTIIEAMSANSAKKADLYFRGIRSAPLDMPKAIMSRMLSSAQFISGHKYNAEIDRAFSETRDQIRLDVPEKNHRPAMAALNELVGRYHDDLTPKAEDTIADGLTGIASAFMLVGSPSYYLQQAIQTYAISGPVLAGRFGLAPSAKAIKTGYAQMAKALGETGGGTLSKGVATYLSSGILDLTHVDPKYREVLRFAENMGLLDVSQNLEMGRVSADVSTGAVDKSMRVIRNSVRMIEAINRGAAIVAAYDLMEAQGKVSPETIASLFDAAPAEFEQRYQDYLDSHKTIASISDRERGNLPPHMSKDQFAAAEFARQVVLDTHGDYSSSNKPVWSRTGAGRVATQFRTFGVVMTGTYAKAIRRAFFDANLSKAEKRVARRTLMYMMGSTAMLAGANGLPLASAFGVLYALVAGAFGDDDEPWPDYEKSVREAVGDPLMSNVLLYGVPSLIGLNVSGSMGLGNMFSLVPNADIPTDVSTFQKYGLALLGGPSISGVGTKAFDAYDLWANKGQTYQAMQALMPRAVQGIAKSIHDANYGTFSRGGDQLIRPEDISVIESLWTFAGFQGADKSARQWSKQRAFEETEYFSNTGASIKRDFNEGKAAGDANMVADARNEWSALQAARARFGFKQQPISQLTAAPQQQAGREKNTAGGIAYTTASKGEALKLGRLAGAVP